MAALPSSSISLVTDQRTILSYNRGPITSVFPVPTSCAGTVSFTPGTASGANGGLFFGHSGTVYDNKCFPTGANSQPVQPDANWAAYYYSPAICPSPYTPARSFTSSYPIWPDPSYLSLGPSTTAALCCPSGYSYSNYGHECYSTVTSGQTLTFFSFSYDGQAWKSGNPVTQAWLSATSVRGDGVPIMWQKSDEALLARASLATPTPSTTPPITSGPTAPTSSPTTSSTPSSSGLSTGAKVGLGIGIPLAILALLGLAFFFWRRRRNRHPKIASSTVYPAGVTEYKDAPTSHTHRPSAYAHEAYGEQMPQELQTNEGWSNRHELPSGVQQR